MNTVKKKVFLYAQICAMPILIFSLTSCGDSPSFIEKTEAQRLPPDDSSEQNSADASVIEKGEKNKEETGEEEGGDANEGSNSGGQNSAKSEDQGPDDSTATGGDGSSQQPSIDPAKTLVEDGGTLVLPGVKAQRVGINFEDFTDADYNDAVLCFVGDFKIDRSDVISYKVQTVSARTFSSSDCDHRIDVRIVNPDGTFTAASYSSRAVAEIPLAFGFLSKLEVTITPIKGICTQTVNMHDPTYARVLADVCNLE